jgi:hypothetical protein
MDIEDRSDGFYYYRRLYLPLQDKKMACFDVNGYMENVWGAGVIKVVLEYYQERGLYDKCAVLQDLQAEFIEKYGELERQN